MHVSLSLVSKSLALSPLHLGAELPKMKPYLHPHGLWRTEWVYMGKSLWVAWGDHARVPKRQWDSASVWFIGTQVPQHRFPMSPFRVSDAQIEDGAKDHLNTAGRRTPRRGRHTGKKKWRTWSCRNQRQRGCWEAFVCKWVCRIVDSIVTASHCIMHFAHIYPHYLLLSYHSPSISSHPLSSTPLSISYIHIRVCLCMHACTLIYHANIMIFSSMYFSADNIILYDWMKLSLYMGIYINEHVHLTFCYWLIRIYYE